MSVYTTKLGDTWDSIAFQLYNDEKKANLLIQENIEYANIIVFSSNIQLNVPEDTTTDIDDDLPPWKRIE